MDNTQITTINDLPNELLRHIAILGGPTEYCTLRRASKRVRSATGDDHCIKHFLVTKVDKFGDTITTLCGKWHSLFDQPAVIYFDGSQEWYRHDELHRANDLPASIDSDGTKIWYRHGVEYTP